MNQTTKTTVYCQPKCNNDRSILHWMQGVSLFLHYYICFLFCLTCVGRFNFHWILREWAKSIFVGLCGKWQKNRQTNQTVIKTKMMTVMSNSKWCFCFTDHTTQPLTESPFHAVFMLEAEWYTSSLAFWTCEWHPVGLLTRKCLMLKVGLKGTHDHVPLRGLEVTWSLQRINRRFWWGPWQLHGSFLQTMT